MIYTHVLNRDGRGVKSPPDAPPLTFHQWNVARMTRLLAFYRFSYSSNRQVLLSSVFLCVES